MNWHKLIVILLLILFHGGCIQSQTNQVEADELDAPTGTPIQIGQKFKFQSKVLGEEKEIYISLPHKYNERIHSYPVVYALEAEILFEPTHTITKLMAARSKMPQSIVVGLANGEFDKRKELGYTIWGGQPDKYLQFFREELIPFVERSYRANKHRTIIGLSPTNGFLIEAFLTDQDLFKGYIALSAHLEWDRVKGVELIDELIAAGSPKTQPNTSLYLGRAKSDLMAHQNVQDAFDDAVLKLKEVNLKNITYKIDVLENEEHYLMSLAGIRAGFAVVYPNSIWRNPGWTGWDKSENYAEKYYKQYHDKLSKIYGFDIFPVEDGHAYGYYLTGKAQVAKKWGTNRQVIDLLELGVGYYPNSANLHMLLAEAYKEKGETEMAIETAEKAIQLAAIYHEDEVSGYEQRLKMLR